MKINEVNMKKIAFAFITCSAAFITSVSHSSSKEAWNEFRTGLFSDCITEVEKIIQPTLMLQDDFGTEHYGVIIFKGMSLTERKYGYVTCIREKTSGKIEVTGLSEDGWVSAAKVK